MDQFGVKRRSATSDSDISAQFQHDRFQLNGCANNEGGWIASA